MYTLRGQQATRGIGRSRRVVLALLTVGCASLMTGCGSSGSSSVSADLSPLLGRWTATTPGYTGFHLDVSANYTWSNNAATPQSGTWTGTKTSTGHWTFVGVNSGNHLWGTGTVTQAADGTLTMTVVDGDTTLTFIK